MKPPTSDLSGVAACVSRFLLTCALLMTSSYSEGFHPDRDASGTKISCEAHADTGGYKETSVKLKFNYRDAFHLYTIRHRHDGIFWLIDGKPVHALEGVKLSHPMKTSLILRTNKHGAMPDAIMEIEYFRFTAEADVLAREQAAAAAAASAATVP